MSNSAITFVVGILDDKEADQIKDYLDREASKEKDSLRVIFKPEKTDVDTLIKNLLIEKKSRPNVEIGAVVVDKELGTNPDWGINNLRTLRQQLPEVRLIFYARHHSIEELGGAIDAGLLADDTICKPRRLGEASPQHEKLYRHLKEHLTLKLQRVSVQKLLTNLENNWKRVHGGDELRLVIGNESKTVKEIIRSPVLTNQIDMLVKNRLMTELFAPGV